MKKADLSPEQYEKNLACSRAWKEKNKLKLAEKESSPAFRLKRREYEKNWRARPEVHEKRLARSRNYNKRQKKKRARIKAKREKLLAKFTPKELRQFLKQEKAAKIKAEREKKRLEHARKKEILLWKMTIDKAILRFKIMRFKRKQRLTEEAERIHLSVEVVTQAIEEYNEGTNVKSLYEQAVEQAIGQVLEMRDKWMNRKALLLRVA